MSAICDGAEALDLETLGAVYARGERTPTEVVAALRARIDSRGPLTKDGVWISLTPAEQLSEAARVVEARRAAGQALPLYGIPFAVKDNIDVAGLPTTAACPAFSYMPETSAPAVARLIEAGALVVGKTNLDQFATGLVGVRSPYGVPRNPFNAAYITGGSSSGSAVAVAVGQVSFALGTDTAGSGRIPAAFNNIVGLKPSRGVISASGVVPACRSLDCVSIFAGTCADAARVAEVARGFDPADPYAHAAADAVAFLPQATPANFRFGIPALRHREFLGDNQASAAFDAAVADWVRLGGTPVVVDLQPFLEAGVMLYDGPFVAERFEAAGALFARDPDLLVPPLRAILEGARRHHASAVFTAQARLRLLSRQVGELWPALDFLLLPTAPTFPTLAAVEADPLGQNAALGRYTTFGNLLNLSALAVPAGFRADGLPAGVTLLGPWGADARLASFGARFHHATSTRLGATSAKLPPAPMPPSRPARPTPASASMAVADPAPVEIAVVGAHLSGEPLNGQLTAVGGRLARACSTAPRYRLFALPNTTPAKPGLLRVADGEETGAAIELEVWALPPAAFAAFVAAIPAPLCIGKVELDDGSRVSGFLCEAHAVNGARDISAFGGWRNYLRSTR
ncbi:MAG: allophanate hydrolase [Myxococcales bacterium]